MFPSSFTNGFVIKLPSTPPPPSSTLHAAFLSIPQCVSDHLQEFQDEVNAALPHHKIPHHYLTKPGLPVFARCLDLPSLLLPRQSFPPWKRQGLSTSKSRTEVGGCVVITTSSILPWFLIVSLFLKSLHVSEVLLFFLNWIYRRGIMGASRVRGHPEDRHHHLQQQIYNHLHRVLCLCLYINIDLQVRNFSSSHIRQRFSIHICNLAWSVLYFGYFSLHYNLLSSSKYQTY